MCSPSMQVLRSTPRSRSIKEILTPLFSPDDLAGVGSATCQVMVGDAWSLGVKRVSDTLGRMLCKCETVTAY